MLHSSQVTRAELTYLCRVTRVHFLFSFFVLQAQLIFNNYYAKTATALAEPQPKYTRETPFFAKTASKMSKVP